MQAIIASSNPLTRWKIKVVSQSMYRVRVVLVDIVRKPLHSALSRFTTPRRNYFGLPVRTLTRSVSKFCDLGPERTHTTSRYCLNHFLLVRTNGGQYSPLIDDDTGLGHSSALVFLHCYQRTVSYAGASFAITPCALLIDPRSRRSSHITNDRRRWRGRVSYMS